MRFLELSTHAQMPGARASAAVRRGEARQERDLDWDSQTPMSTVRGRSIAVGLRGICLAVCAKLRGEGTLRCDIDMLITAGAE